MGRFACLQHYQVLDFRTVQLAHSESCTWYGDDEWVHQSRISANEESAKHRSPSGLGAGIYWTLLCSSSGNGSVRSFHAAVFTVGGRSLRILWLSSSARRDHCGNRGWVPPTIWCAFFSQDRISYAAWWDWFGEFSFIRCYRIPRLFLIDMFLGRICCSVFHCWRYGTWKIKITIWGHLTFFDRPKSN